MTHARVIKSLEEANNEVSIAYDAGEKYSMDGGLTLVRNKNNFRLLRGNDLVGSAHVYEYDPNDGIRPLGVASSVPAVRDIIVYERGKGFGRMLLSKLVEIYGQIRSDPTGQTSDEAARMWRSLGSRSLTYADKGFGDSWYALPNP